MGVCCSTGAGKVPRISISYSVSLNSDGKPTSRSYKILSTIKSRHNSLVFEAKAMDESINDIVVIKSLMKEKFLDICSLKNELSILSKLDDENIVRLIDFYEDEMFLNLVLEYCNGGDLYDKLYTEGPLVEAEAAHWLSSACKALVYLHSLDICHRDVKPGNFLIKTNGDRVTYKLADFGLSVLNSEVCMKSMVGTLNYAAPEVIQGKYTKQCDVWSLGVSLFSVLSRTYPFYSGNPAKTMKKIMGRDVAFTQKVWDGVSINAKDLISRMLKKDYKERITLSEILNSPWMNTYFP